MFINGIILVLLLIAIAIILLKRPDKIWKDTLVLIMPVITGIELHRFLSLKPVTFLGTDDAFFWQELNAGPILPKLVILLIIVCVMMDIIAVYKPVPIKENTEEENPFK